MFKPRHLIHAAIIVFSPSAMSMSETIVIGHPPDLTNPNGNYYLGSYYYHWYQQQAAKRAAAAQTSNESSSQPKATEAERCIELAGVNLALCEKTAHNLSSTEAVHCTVTRLFGLYDACENIRKANLDSALADCQFQRSVDAYACKYKP